MTRAHLLPGLRLRRRGLRGGAGGDRAGALAPSAPLLAAFDDCEALLLRWGPDDEVAPPTVLPGGPAPAEDAPGPPPSDARRGRVTGAYGPRRRLRRAAPYLSLCTIAAGVGWLVTTLVR